MVDRLLEDCHDVTVVDDLSNGHLSFLNRRLSRDDLWVSDFAAATVLDRVRDQHYDFVFHLAAEPRVSFSVERPFESNETNVSKTIKLLDACKGNVQRFIFASSSAVYGDGVSLPTPVDSPTNPMSPYALQKLTVEKYLKLFWSLHRLDSVALRFFNVYGPRGLGGSPYSTAVSSWLTAIKSNRPMRSDGDGTQTRDMCYVKNVTDACVLAACKSESLKGDVFNVGHGERYSNNEILTYLKSRYPQSTHYDAPKRPGDVMHTFADITHTHDVLGYVPVVDFWSGLKETIDWYETNWDHAKELIDCQR